MCAKTKIRCDISVIKQILPHREPFLFVDRVTELEVDYRISAEKILLPDHCLFSGHFPGNPMMPGVLVSEALAQTSGLLLGLSWREGGRPIKEKKSPFFYLASVNTKFSSPAKPGETLGLQATLKKHYGNFFYFEVTAHVRDRQIATGTLSLAEKS